MNKSKIEFLSGMQNIEKKITDGLKLSSDYVNRVTFRWNKGADVFPIPSNISLTVGFDEKTIEVVFSREQLEDSWDRVSRPDVRACILHTVLSLKQ